MWRDLVPGGRVPRWWQCDAGGGNGMWVLATSANRPKQQVTTWAPRPQVGKFGATAHMSEHFQSLHLSKHLFEAADVTETTTGEQLQTIQFTLGI
jgi:hypothetical protein